MYINVKLMKYKGEGEIMKQLQLSKKNIYKWGMASLSIITIILIVLDYAALIRLDNPSSKWFWINNIILLIFAADYFIRLQKAEDKKVFFKNNIFELLSILPISIVFDWTKIISISLQIPIKLLRLVRLAGVVGRLRKTLHTHDLLYVIYFAIAFLLIGSVVISLTEHVSLDDAFWWAISTASTVGYGDIADKTLVPHSIIGKTVALIMMLLGIGIIGVLTSSLTSHVMRHSNRDSVTNNQTMQLIIEKLNELSEQNKELMSQNKELKSEIEEIKSKTGSNEWHKFKRWIKNKE